MTIVVKDNILFGMPNPLSADQAPEPARLFRDLARMHVTAQRALLTQMRGTAAQCTVLTQLERSGPVSLAALTAALRLDKGWISRSIEQLVQDGFVTRRTDDRDRRAVRLALTAQGRRKAQAVNEALDHQLESDFGRRTGSERSEVVRGLVLLTEAYHAELQDTGRGDE